MRPGSRPGFGRRIATASGLGLLIGLGLVVVLVATLLAFGEPVGSSLSLIASGAFGDRYAVARSLVLFVPLLLCGSAVAVAWRAGMYNIGGEGQFVVGGLAGAWTARALLAVGAPGWTVSTSVLAACAAGGAAFGALACWLHVRRGVNVVIGTILLNFVALQLLSWAVGGPLRDPRGSLPLTTELPASAMLYRPDPTSDLNLGLPIALAAWCGVGWLLLRSRSGYVMRMVGLNARAVRLSGVDPDRAQYLAMAISGGLFGLSGAIEYLGIAGQLGAEFAQNWGYVAIPVALLGGLRPGGVLLAAAFFGVLLAGSSNLARFTSGGDTLVYVVQAAAVLGLVSARAVAARRAGVAG